MTDAANTPDPASSDGDPYHEPENSTVDDWIGQSVQRDAELAERLVDEAGGDLAAAEERYEAESEQGAGTNQAKNRPDD